MVRYTVTVNGEEYEVDVEEIAPGKYRVRVNGKEEIIEMLEIREEKVLQNPEPETPTPSGNGEEIKAEMAGTVVKVLVKSGDEVKKGQPLLVIEAMKMENEIVAPFDGVIASVEVSESARVQAGDVLVKIDASGKSSSEDASANERSDGNVVKAEVAGTIVRILKKEGDKVKRGEPVIVIEAMKMENEIVAPFDGKLSKIFVREGDRVQVGSGLFSLS